MALKGKVVFSSGIAVNFDLWSVDLGTGTLVQLTHGENVNDFPRWSPDGKQIAFVSTQEDSIPSLWVMRADGHDKRRITNNIYCQAPSWSPDGSHLIFVANAGNPNDIDVCTIGFDGKSAAPLFKYQGIEENPSYSPDGQRVVFSAQALTQSGETAGSDTEIVEYSLSGRSFRILFSHPAKDYAPVYSPDGSRIAFVSHRNDRSGEEYEKAYKEFRDIIVKGNSAEARTAMEKMKRFEQDGDIFVAKSDGTDLKQLTHDSEADDGVCWSPCGKYLMYSSASLKEHETERLKAIDAQSGARVPFQFDRVPLEKEIGSYQMLNTAFLSGLVPDFIERLFVQRSFWGEERRPHWIG